MIFGKKKQNKDIDTVLNKLKILLTYIEKGERLVHSSWINNYDDVQRYIFSNSIITDYFKGWERDDTCKRGFAGAEFIYNINTSNLCYGNWYVWKGHHFNQTVDEIQLAAERAFPDKYLKRIC